MPKLAAWRVPVRRSFELLPYSLRWRAYALHWAHLVRATDVVSESPRIFFLVGCQRSGTTMLQLALDSHPRIVLHSERRSDELVGQRFEEAERVVGLKLPMWTLQRERLTRMYPQAKFLFLRREMRAVVASMLELQLRNGPWIRTDAVWELERTLSYVTEPRLRKRATADYARYRQAGNWVSIAALMAHVKASALRDYVRAGAPVLDVSYERLVASPREAFADILSFLDVPWSDDILHHAKFHAGLTTGKTDASRAIDSASLERWRTTLDTNALATLDRVVARLEQP